MNFSSTLSFFFLLSRSLWLSPSLLVSRSSLLVCLCLSLVFLHPSWDRRGWRFHSTCGKNRVSGNNWWSQVFILDNIVHLCVKSLMFSLSLSLSFSLSLAFWWFHSTAHSYSSAFVFISLFLLFFSRLFSILHLTACYSWDRWTWGRKATSSLRRETHIIQLNVWPRHVV